MGEHGKYRPLVRLAVLLLALWPLPASAACRQALAIGLDISGSVDEEEYRLQMHGLAGALLNPDVSAAFLAIPDAPVRLFVYEWAGTNTQRPLVGWTDVTDASILRRIAGVLRTTTRQPRQVETALGRAMVYGGRQLAGQGDCWRLTLDLSGDGESNIGPGPRDVAGGLLSRITINAVVIGKPAAPFLDASESEIARLTAYFLTEVVRGPDAFVEAAFGFTDFEDAMARKLLKELATLAIGGLLPGDQ